jgi:hypothetical protein
MDSAYDGNDEMAEELFGLAVRAGHRPFAPPIPRLGRRKQKLKPNLKEGCPIDIIAS